MKRGFTLIEVMIVMAIVSLLAAIAIPTLRDARSETKSHAHILEHINRNNFQRCTECGTKLNATYKLALDNINRNVLSLEQYNKLRLKRRSAFNTEMLQLKDSTMRNDRTITTHRTVTKQCVVTNYIDFYRTNYVDVVKDDHSVYSTMLDKSFSDF